MTDSKRDGTKYEAPRAIRLKDARTGTFECLDGPSGTPDICRSGFGVQGGNVCNAGSEVQTF